MKILKKNTIKIYAVNKKDIYLNLWEQYYEEFDITTWILPEYWSFLEDEKS